MDVDEHHKTNASEIASLIAAASCVSTDSSGPPNGDTDVDTPTINRFAAPESTQPDVQVEKRELLYRLEQAIRDLPPLDQKMLRLRGVTL